jgi:hypothetical protein
VIFGDSLRLEGECDGIFEADELDEAALAISRDANAFDLR